MTTRTFHRRIEIEKQVFLERTVQKGITRSLTFLHQIVEGRVRFQYSGQQWSAGPGQVIWSPVATTHSRTLSQGAKQWTLRVWPQIWAVQSAADQEALKLIQSFNAIAWKYGPVFKLHSTTRDRISEILCDLSLTWKSPELPHYQCAMKSGVLNILVALSADKSLSRYSVTDAQMDMKHNAVVAVLPALELLDLRDYLCFEDCSVTALAKVCGYKASRFHTLFLLATDTTPQRYVTERRITLACELLLKSHSSVLEVAFACGFRSQSRFYQAFNEITGLSPGKWIQKKTIYDLR